MDYSTPAIEPGTTEERPNPVVAAPPERRRGRILFSLLGVLVLVGLVPLGSVAWKLIDTNREALKTTHQELQLLLASGVANQVDAQVDGLRSQVARLAKRLAGLFLRTPSATGDDVREVLAEVADDRTLYLRFTDLKGQVLDTREVTATLSPELEPEFARAYRRAAEAVSGEEQTEADSVTVSDPVLLSGASPRAAVILSLPVIQRGAFRGILSVLVDLQSAWDAVVRSDHSGHTIFAVDGRGRLFATNRSEDMRPGLGIERSEIVVRFLSVPGRRARQTMPFLLDRGGAPERYLGSYEVTRQGWGVFVQARERDVYLPVRAMVRSTLSWAATALLLAVLAAVAFARGLSRPIGHLAEASRAFAAGTFSVRAEVRSRNEIGDLADAFNRMASDIEGYIRSLRRAAEENNELFLGTIRALAQAIDAKDPYTRGHSVRVNKYAVILARHLGLSEEEIRDIHVASLLHDVGKIGIDDAILKKPSALTREEFAVMKTHPLLGASIMAPIRQMRRLLPGMRNHHERWGGGGYPDGLEGDAIPLMARIIAVADTFDAMTTDRPYQAAQTFEAAIDRLNALKGSVLDERVVEAFNLAFRSGALDPEPRAHDLRAEASAPA